MLEEGNIIYFTPFYFKNGNDPAPKFFIVLKKNGSDSLLASLPTSKDKLPLSNSITDGCIEVPESGINCFMISNTKIITKCNKKFDVTTHIYGFEIDTYPVSKLEEAYAVEGVDYKVFGNMKKRIFTELINCLTNSKTVKKKHINFLNS
ncbi:hypothetical protein DNU06_02560 [Putridiphycobacter roseus]|uniref:Uncharacterized protein n=1 Tax=Putridiphycobacter roseus TaxID=2219161 RepID=A0A2W1N265_9FLAO|nr:hypothetical protein [Putridiphycobacter roseus]PZE18729.1 hypothetical protein DNU06_02560 [Putridiphycobacter roseus]